MPRRKKRSPGNPQSGQSEDSVRTQRPHTNVNRDLSDEEILEQSEKEGTTIRRLKKWIRGQ